MDKETAPIQEKTKSKGKLQIIFSALLAAAVFVIELYAMINQPQSQYTVAVG